MNVLDPYSKFSHGQVNLGRQRKYFEITKVKIQKKWSIEDDKLLLELTNKFKGKNWKNISYHFENKTPLQCFSRFKRIRPGIKKGSWTKMEDERLLELVGIYGKCWSKISKVIQTRNGKQIRDRYINILDQGIKKGKFSIEEDLKLYNLYKQYGTKWAQISCSFENRTADMLKNRYHSSIKRNMKRLEELEEEFYSINNFQEINFSEVQNLDFSQIYSPKSNFLISDYSCSNENSTLYPHEKSDSLVVQNAINLTFIQESCSLSPASDFHYEDFFVL